MAIPSISTLSPSMPKMFGEPPEMDLTRGWGGQIMAHVMGDQVLAVSDDGFLLKAPALMVNGERRPLPLRRGQGRHDLTRNYPARSALGHGEVSCWRTC